MHITTNELDVYLVIGLRGRGRGWFIHSFLFVIGSDKKEVVGSIRATFLLAENFVVPVLRRTKSKAAARVDTMATACPKSDKKREKKEIQ